MVAGLDDSSRGYGFTTHCAPGLLFDAEVVPLAAGEMSCLVPFPYTPKPNEQRGARLRDLLYAYNLDLSLPPSGSFLAMLFLRAAVRLLPLSIYPTLFL